MPAGRCSNTIHQHPAQPLLSSGVGVGYRASFAVVLSTPRVVPTAGQRAGCAMTWEQQSTGSRKGQ